MALRNVLTEEDSALYKKSRGVTKFDDRLHTLLDDMKETLLHANGVGLAAPQVGVLRRAVLVMETNVPEEEEPYVAGPIFLRLGDMFLHGLGTEQNPLNALVAYQKAELFLYQMVQNDQPMYRKSLESAIEGQENARKALELPQDTWIVDR